MKPHVAAMILALGLGFWGPKAQVPAPVSAEGAQAAPAPRPKIALALSGGGARGAAHIGVLKVLEELHVPVDYVAGTSMGAVVGGFYASGMSPEEIQKSLDAMDWDAILTGKPPRKEVSFRTKKDEYVYGGNIEMGLKHYRLTAPMGFISGQNFDLALQRLTLPVATVHDFDRLPIPFRCVATDLVSGESVVFSKGNLAQAIRASMSLPGFLPPVESDGRLLVDGGLKNNLPVDVAKAMGADVVIAVNIGRPPAKKEDLKSFFAISGQIVALLQEESIEKRAKMADLLILPRVGGITVTDYAKMDDAVSRGEAAARAMAPQTERYAVTPQEYEAFLARQRRGPQKPIMVDTVRFEGGAETDQRMVEKRLTVKPGVPLDRPALEKDLARIWDIGDYESVTYGLVPVGGRTELIIRATPKPWGPNYVKFALNFQTDLEGHATFNLLGSLTKSRINALGAEWRSDLQVGRTNRLYTEFYQPVNFQTNVFLAPWAEVREDLEDVYSGDSRVAEYRVRRPRAGLDLGFRLGQYGELRLGPVWGRVNAVVDVGDPVLPRLDTTWGGVQAQMVIDQLDNASFPRRGTLDAVTYFHGIPGMGSQSDYRRLDFSLAQYASRGSHTLSARLMGGTSLGTALPAYDQFTLGGFYSFSGYREWQLRGRYFAVGRLGYSYRFASLPTTVGRGIYLGTWVDVGNTWMTIDQVGNDLRYSGTLYLGADTRIGPFYLGYGQAKDGNHSLYITLGRSF